MISKYKICEPIGQGFSCKVYRALNTENSQYYAVKVINHSQLKEQQLKLLRSEIEFLFQLSCQNIIKIYDVVKDAKATFIITELCEYGSVEDQINNNKLFNDKLAFNLLLQMINALMTLKRQKIIHNDIKPSNIFLQQNQFKLADFGFAVKENAMLDFNCGSPLYMSPEALQNNQHTYQSDIWSLGITIYQSVHGHTPFQVKTEQELLNCYITKPISFKKDFNPKLQNIIQKMLIVDPNKRINIEALWNIVNDKENNNANTNTSLIIDRKKSIGLNKQPFHFQESTLNVCNFIKQIRQEVVDNELLVYALTGLILYYTKQEQQTDFNQITVIVEQQRQPNIFQMVKSDLLKFCMTQLSCTISQLQEQLKILHQNFFHIQVKNVKLLINLFNLYQFLRLGENYPLKLVNEEISYLEAKQLISQIRC